MEPTEAELWERPAAKRRRLNDEVTDLISVGMCLLPSPLKPCIYKRLACLPPGNLHIISDYKGLICDLLFKLGRGGGGASSYVSQ